MKLHLLLAALILAAISCKDKKEPAPAVTPPNTPDKVITYLPVPELIRDDIKRVDSFASGIMRKTQRADKKDSAYITVADFRQLAGTFLSPELDSNNFRQQFSEESLMDESTRLLNFIYTAKDTSQALRKVIVYITPANYVDKVNVVYMEKEFMEGNVFVQQKLTWKTAQYFSILTIRQPTSGEAVSTMEKVIWDPQHFAD